MLIYFLRLRFFARRFISADRSSGVSESQYARLAWRAAAAFSSSVALAQRARTARRRCSDRSTMAAP